MNKQEFLPLNPPSLPSCNTIIVGPNKSGKTGLLLYKAKKLELQGKSYLFIVLSNIYGSFIQSGFNEIGLRKGEIMTFWEWKHKGPHPRYDCLLIDDVDTFFDLTEEDINSFMNACAGPIYVTLLQKEYACDVSNFYVILRNKGFKECTLYTSHSPYKHFIRNIFFDNKVLEFQEQRMLPQIIVCDSDTEVSSALKNFINKQLDCWNSCAIVVYTHEQVEKLSCLLKSLKIKHEAERQVYFSSDYPKILTIYQSVGLSFDSIIFFVEDTIKDFYKETFYRSLHNACKELVFLSRKTIPSWLNSIPSSQYERIYYTDEILEI